MVKTVDVLSLFELQKIKGELNFIDVREKDEFDDVHADGAKNFPLSSLNPENVLKALGIEKTQAIYVICASGARSAVAAEQFRKIGCEDVSNVQGGTHAWMAADLPLG